MRHHPDDAQLVGYAAGTQSPAVEVLLASHLTLCPACRSRVGELEDIAGAMLELAPPVDASNGQAPLQPADPRMLDRLIAMLDDPPAVGREQAETGAAAKAVDGLLLPRPLRRHVGSDINRLAWRRPIRGVERARLPFGSGGDSACLLRVQPGAAVPRHTHAGSEMTLVLEGGYTDRYGHYARGDVTVSDAQVEHDPVADPEGTCLCLVVADGPIRLTGRLTRLLNPFIR